MRQCEKIPVCLWSIWSMIFTVFRAMMEERLVTDLGKVTPLVKNLDMDQKTKEQIVEDQESLIKTTSLDLQSVLEKLNGLEKQMKKKKLATESKQKVVPAAQVMTMSKKI